MESEQGNVTVITLGHFSTNTVGYNQATMQYFKQANPPDMTRSSLLANLKNPRELLNGQPKEAELNNQEQSLAGCSVV